jgi:type II secretory pathway pseudopilin PulG
VSWMASHSHARRRASRRGEQGYILLTLMLVICMMIIFAAAIVPSITFNIRRDREEEMIHRGVQYSRAIRAYYKKFGRYPTKIDDLENTNNMRFLRKRYKDPLNCKNSKCEDFKLLHFGDVKLTFSAGIGGGGINGATPVNGAPPFGQTPPAGGINPGSGFANSGGFGGSQGSFGANSNAAPGSNATAAPGQGQNSNSDSTTLDGSSAAPALAPGEHPGVTGQDQLAGTTFGGGPIVGVVSAIKKDTIREFNHKKKYNEWQFIYDPATDRGGLITTPNQPPIQGFGVSPQNLNGQTNGGQNTGGAGTSGFGPVQGMPNNPNPPTTVGPGTNQPQQ